jgi:hypothetical protein
MAAVVFAGPDEGDFSDPLYVHKKQCHDEAERRIRATGKHAHWQELKHNLAYLLHNVGCPVPEIPLIDQLP